MELSDDWRAVTDALDVAVRCIADDVDGLDDRAAADGHGYILRILSAATQNLLAPIDPDRPAFMPMLEATRHLGAAGPDIDYDVAAIRPGVPHRITGTRGSASYVGICLYAHAGADGASGLVGNVDVDDLVGDDGTFTYEFTNEAAGRVIVRQYFHDRTTQRRGSFTIERLDGMDPPRRLPTAEDTAARLKNLAASVQWNARLNQLWGAEYREAPNTFVRQSAAEIVAAVPNPDVTYAFGWWKIAAGEALLVEHTPPPTRYWGLQLCDRWFQCYPDRRSNLNDRQIVAEPDGSARLVIAGTDPGHPNWIDTSGHTVGTMFFRWLHADPVELPTCRIVRLGDVPPVGGA